MKRKLRLITILMAVLFTFSACAGAKGGGINEETLDFTTRSVEIDICDPIVRNYLDATDYETEFAALKVMTGSNKDVQVAKVTVKVQKDAPKPYSFVISSEADFAQFTATEIEIDGTADEQGYIQVVYDVEKSLIPGNEYFWKVTDKDGKTADYGKICVKDAPVRFVNIDNIRNVRDIGGWTAENGKKVAYGLIYRGTRLNGYSDGRMLLSDAGKAKMRDELGMMTEIDLRANDDSTGIDNTVQKKCFFGETVKAKNDRNYLKCAIGQYDHITGYQSCVYLKQIFSYFAKESNYPIYMHCNSGADRTGTVAFLLNGLLGVSFEDLTRDFELTSTFSVRWRSTGAESFEGTEANKSGLFQSDDGNYINWGKLYTDMMEFSKNGTLQNGIENFLKERAEITDEQIARIKSILLK